MSRESEQTSPGQTSEIQPATVDTYHVFLASPSDVHEERAEVRAFFTRFNRTDARGRGFQFEVVDWENYSTAGVGRPQELITEQTLGRYQMSLALVIGVMAQRFGSPSGTHESGTEEEFEWALVAAQKGLLEIKWFFRNVSHLVIPTTAHRNERFEALEQWDKVQEFRRRMEDEKLAHNQTFTDLEDFRGRFDSDLRLWLNAPHRAWNTKHAGLTRLRRQLPPRDQRFRGRVHELKILHETLMTQRNAGVNQRVGTWGHGGLGKSALAIEYAWQHVDDYPGGIYWLSADAPGLAPGLASLAPTLGLADQMNTHEVAARVRDILSSGAPALLIVDNVPGHEWVREHQSNLPSGQCQLLVTTRAEALPGVKLIALNRLADADGKALLVTLASSRGDASAPDNVEAISRIVETCEGLPVAIVAAGAYLALEPNVTWVDYARRVGQRGLTALRASSNRARATLDYAPSLDLVFSDLFAALPVAQQRVLEYATLLPADGVPDFWLHDLLDREDVALQEAPGYDRPAQAVVSDLVQRHLVHRLDDRERFVAVHRLFAAWIAERLDAEPANRAVRLANISDFATTRANVVKGAAARPELRPELTPLVSLVRTLEDYGERQSAAELASLLWALEDLGRYSEWQSVLERFVTETGHELDSEHEELGTAVLSNLAIILRHMGDLDGARKRIERAIAIKERTLQPDHLSLAPTYSNLALILQDLGDLQGARAQLERAISIEEKHLPPDHFTLATSYSNLALVLRDLNDRQNARSYVERAISILQKHFPPDHLSLAVPYSNLALILQDAGELHDARDRIERAVAIILEHFPPDHPSLATPYSNLALILRDLEDLHGARSHAERALEILRKHLPTDHPNLAILYLNFALILRDLGDLPQARAQVEHAIEIGEKHFTSDHPDLAAARSILILLLRDVGNSIHEKKSLGHVATHLAAVVQPRNRTGLPEGAAIAPSPAARSSVYEPSSEERLAKARKALRSAITELETAHGGRHVEIQTVQLDDWRGPLAGGWSLVDEVEHGGRRYLVARAPAPAALAALSNREKQVIGYARLGHHNKLIAYELGISMSTVRVLMSRAAAKLGARTRAELLRAVDSSIGDNPSR